MVPVSFMEIAQAIHEISRQQDLSGRTTCKQCLRRCVAKA